jgi:tetratricopeptide (TPR) repeat protein
MFKRIWIILLITLFTHIIATAQHQGHHGAQSGKAAQLLPEMGNHHHPITTSSAEAQKFFDQGLLLLYAFNHDEAARSFKRAVDLDADLAMGWWGIALANGSNYNLGPIPEREKAAYEAIQKALALISKVSEKERDYINALARRYSIDPNADLAKQAVTYKNAMGEIVKKYPDDLDAATLYAESAMNLRPWKLWYKDGKPAEGTEEIVAVLESVLKRKPDHLGANHYYIHAVEASPSPERALPSAMRLGKLAPGAGHLVHMPAHITIQTGDYEFSLKSNEDAEVADRTYLEKTGTKAGIYPAMYYSHNIDFIVEAGSRAGRYADSRSAAERLSSNVRPYLKDMPMIEFFLGREIFVLVRFNKWDDMLKMPEPDASAPITKALWHYGRGVAFAATGKVADAEKSRQSLKSAQEKLPADSPYGNNKLGDVLTVAALVLDAKIAQTRGDSGKAIELFEKGVHAQDALAYDEPPGWHYPVRESLGVALVRAGKFAEAEKVFREGLERMPRDGRLLFGLHESLKRQNNNQAARLIWIEFESAWKQADTKLRLEDL